MARVPFFIHPLNSSPCLVPSHSHSLWTSFFPFYLQTHTERDTHTRFAYAVICLSLILYLNLHKFVYILSLRITSFQRFSFISDLALFIHGYLHTLLLFLFFPFAFASLFYFFSLDASTSLGFFFLIVAFVNIAMLILAMRECVYIYNMHGWMFFAFLLQQNLLVPYIVLSVLGFAFIFSLPRANCHVIYIKFCRLNLNVEFLSYVVVAAGTVPFLLAVCAASKCSSCIARESSYRILFMLLHIHTAAPFFLGYQ